MKKFFKFGCLGIIAAVVGGGDSEEVKKRKSQNF
ncbi:hypothetical protein BAMO111457_04130 [Bacillus mobilis]